MDGLIRTLLVWLLALAIPAQASAAATMAFCGPKHHGDVAVAVAVADAVAVAQADHTAAPAGHDHHGAEAGMAHEHSGAHDALTASPGPGEHSSAAQAKAGSADTHKCNVCGSCCSTGALMSTLPALPVVEATAATFSPVAATVDPFSAGGPDRPPRTARV